MDRASSLIYPGSKTLAGWWRQLQAHQPKALWIGYAFLHRVEASVHVVRAQPIEPLTHLVLRAVGLDQAANPAAAVSVAGLEARLRLPAAVVQRVLLDMQSGGLLTRLGRRLAHVRAAAGMPWSIATIPIASRNAAFSPFWNASTRPGSGLPRRYSCPLPNVPASTGLPMTPIASTSPGSKRASISRANGEKPLVSRSTLKRSRTARVRTTGNTWWSIGPSVRCWH